MNSIDKALEWAQSIQLFAPVSTHHWRACKELWPILEPLNIETALEVGTGQPPGMVVAILREHGVKAVGLDTQPGSDYQGDMHELPFEDGSFDLVIARHSLEHVLIPYVCLREMARVSKQWLLVIVPPDTDKAVEWPDHLHGYSQKGWEMMFRKCGLTVRHYELGDHTEENVNWVDQEHRWLLQKEGE